jgi:hypothetical protein
MTKTGPSQYALRVRKKARNSLTNDKAPPVWNLDAPTDNCRIDQAKRRYSKGLLPEGSCQEDDISYLQTGIVKNGPDLKFDWRRLICPIRGKDLEHRTP